MKHKFRAWDKENKRWMTPEIEHNEESELRLDIWGNLYFKKPWFEQEPGTVTTVSGKNMFDLSQSTGLKDKNGVEIYEGDILYHPLQGARKVFYPYSDSVASYGLREISTGFGSTLQDAHAVWQVIGNIYENPELMEVEE